MALPALPWEIMALLEHLDFSQPVFKLYRCCSSCGNCFSLNISSTLGKLLPHAENFLGFVKAVKGSIRVLS